MTLEEYLSTFIIRYDRSPLLSYFEPKDYPGLMMDDFSFEYKGKKLNGGYFYYPNYKKDELVIFSNGLACGYVSYMVEIERLAQAGFRVLSVDNLGVFSSEGENINSITESLAILDSLLNYLSTFDWYKKTKIKLVGHSMGGYAVSNIMNYHSEIKAIAVLSGFVKVDSFLKANNAGKEVLEYEINKNPKYAKSNALDAIKDKNVPIVFIHSIDDPVIPYQDNFMYLKNNIEKPNIRFITVDKKGHNPDYTEDGVAYMQQVFTKLLSLQGQEAIDYSKTIDYKRITRLDEIVFREIINTLQLE